MMKIKTQKIKEYLGKILKFIHRHVCLICLFIFCFILIFGGIIFYKYGILIQKTEVEILRPFQLKEKEYQKVLEILQEKEEKFEEAGLKEYSDTFNEPFVVPEKQKLAPPSGLTE